MNKNYIRGRNAEYKVRDLLRLEGYLVLRTAGSHGPFDLIAIRGSDPVRCIQVKSSARSLTPDQLDLFPSGSAGFSAPLEGSPHFVQELALVANGRVDFRRLDAV